MGLKDCKTVIMNGPMGVFEFEKFNKGTFGIVQILADITKDGAVTIIGGGDSVAACEQSGLAGEMSHISTGGGAHLSFLRVRYFLELLLLLISKYFRFKQCKEMGTTYRVLSC